MKKIFTLLVVVLKLSFGIAQIQNDTFQNSITLHDKADENTILAYAISLEKEFPTDVNTLFLRGNYFYKTGNIVEAEECYSNILKLDPKNVLSYIARATINIQKKQFDHAIYDLSNAIKYDQKNIKIYDLRSKVYLQIGKNNEALRDIDTKIALQPLQIKHYLEAANICMKMHENSKGEMYFTKAFTTAGMDITIVNLAYCEYLMQLQRYEDAMFRYLDAIKINEKALSGIDYNNIAVAYFKLNNILSAKKYAEIAIKKSPLNLEYKCNYITILVKKNEWKKVAEISNSVLLLNKNHANAKEFLATALGNLNQ